MKKILKIIASERGEVLSNLQQTYVVFDTVQVYVRHRHESVRLLNNSMWFEVSV